VNIPVSRRIQRVKPSPTIAMTARAAQLRAEGKDIISLSAGEPDFDTPAHIAEAGVAAIQGGHTRYTDVGGTPELKDAISAKFERDNGLVRAQPDPRLERRQADHLQPVHGRARPGRRGDHPVAVLGVVSGHGHARRRPAGDARRHRRAGLQDHAAQLEAAITPDPAAAAEHAVQPDRCRVHAAELRALGEVLLQYPRVLIGTDDMYEKIYWGAEPFCSLVTAVPELYDRTVTINGCSKAYAMTGWRIGYCGGPREIITAMATVQGQSTSNPSSISPEGRRRGVEWRSGVRHE
jgi:aspartate aminotransferase